MQNGNSYTQIKEIVKLKKSLEMKQKMKLDKDECLKFFATYQYCMRRMRKNLRDILQNSYFDVRYKFWWVDEYCKSSFYRMRARAVSCFVNLFNTIYENFSYFSNNIVRDFK